MVMDKKVKKAVSIFAFFILGLAFSCFARSSKYIRVAIIQNTVSLNLAVKGFYRIVDSVNNAVLSKGRHLSVDVRSDKSGIKIKGINYKTGRILIEADDPESIMINDRKYRGNIEFIKKENGHLLVVNYIEIEDYAKGILYHEVSHYWPMEALKAQAVACRTYADYQMEQNKSKDYDVTCDIYSQVYGGKTSERYRTTEAVEKTSGETLVYKNKIFPAYFHATCAGNTLNANQLWNIDIPPLKGVACPFCADSPHFNWHCVLSLREIRGKLAKFGIKVDNLKNIVILGRDDSGRIERLELVGADEGVEISSKDFRNSIGPNIIKSANFKVEIADSDAVFEGLGWGHGVGMCQWGAYFMAKQRYKYKEILEYYYPGGEIKTNE